MQTSCPEKVSEQDVFVLSVEKETIINKTSLRAGYFLLDSVFFYVIILYIKKVFHHFEKCPVSVPWDSGNLFAASGGRFLSFSSKGGWYHEPGS